MPRISTFAENSRGTQEETDTDEDDESNYMSKTDVDLFAFKPLDVSIQAAEQETKSERL